MKCFYFHTVNVKTSRPLKFGADAPVQCLEASLQQRLQTNSLFRRDGRSTAHA